MDALPSGSAAEPLRLLLPASRREFLIRCGLLGAGTVLAGPLASIARAQSPAEDLIDAFAPIMRQLAHDTFAGLAVMAVPGPDEYSIAQGETSPTPGAIEAQAHLLVMESADYFVPLPDTYAQALAAAFATGMSDTPLPADALAQLGLGLEQQAVTLDAALRELLESDATMPLSLLFALTLNFEATAVNPASIAGPFPLSPFANLSLADKASVFERLERADSDLVATLDSGAPEPMRAGLSNLLKFVGGTLLEFAGYTAYVERAVFDPQTGTATGRPVGWDTTQYLLGHDAPVDGWDELLGYYRKRRRSAGAAPLYRPKRKKRKRKARRRKGGRNA